MELSSPVKNKFGQILIAEGSKLEERHRTILLTWGIQNIYVNETDDKMEAQYDEKVLNNARELIKARINWEYRNYSEEELYNLALDELLKKINS